jgi:hypothetical protein
MRRSQAIDSSSRPKSRFDFLRCPEAALAICERVAEVQALLDDHLARGNHSAADVVAKAKAVLSESALLRALFDVGYFPPNTPPADNEAPL